MFASLLILLVLPFTDLSRIRGNHFKPLSRVLFWLIVCTFFLLMELGSRHAEAPYILMGQVATALYFSYFLILVPVVTLLENSLVDINMQTSITKAANLNSYFKNLRLVYAIFLPKAHITQNRRQAGYPESVARLEILPGGHRFFDDILISILIIERDRRGRGENLNIHPFKASDPVPWLWQ